MNSQGDRFLSDVAVRACTCVCWVTRQRAGLTRPPRQYYSGGGIDVRGGGVLISANDSFIGDVGDYGGAISASGAVINLHGDAFADNSAVRRPRRPPLPTPLFILTLTPQQFDGGAIVQFSGTVNSQGDTFASDGAVRSFKSFCLLVPAPTRRFHPPTPVERRRDRL